MSKKCLHITNGNALTDYLRELGFKEDILTWQEMLCEGPTIPAIDSEEFFKLRSEFLKSYYDIEVNNVELKKELSKLDSVDDYLEFNLWFEYDLFCHINLLGVINLLHQKEIKKPLYLICSGRVEGEKSLKSLAELNSGQLHKHYKNKVLLSQEDINLANALWRTYCGKDHNILKPYIVKNSSFEYMSNCLKAHLQRFPQQQNGLSVLEENILKIIKENTINSEHHLLGYALNYQGFYEYGDIQLQRLIDNLAPFYSVNEDNIELNRKGHEILLGQYNASKDYKDNMVFGGVKKLGFQFSKSENKLIKSPLNVN